MHPPNDRVGQRPNERICVLVGIVPESLHGLCERERQIEWASVWRYDNGTEQRKAIPIDDAALGDELIDGVQVAQRRTSDEGDAIMRRSHTAASSSTH